MFECMPQEQYDFITTIQKECLETTNMTEDEAWTFGFRCWQLKYVKQKQGEWMAQDDTFTRFTCSACGSENHDTRWEYCCKCGAKMG